MSQKVLDIDLTDTERVIIDEGNDQYEKTVAGVSGKEILFIDDKVDFLEPARRLGWQTVLFEENNPKQSINVIESLF